MANNGFWDRFSQAYTPAAQQGAAATLQQMAVRQKEKRDADLLAESQNRALGQMMMRSGDPTSMQQGAVMLGEEENLRPLVTAGAKKHLAGLSPGQFQKLAEAEEEKGMHTEGYEGPYSAEMFGEIAPVQQQAKDDRTRMLNKERRSQRLAEAEALPEYMRAQYLGIDTEGISDEDPTVWKKREDILRKEYITRTSHYSKVQNAWVNIMNAIKGGTGISDQVLVQQFSRMLDPDSVVREGEYASTAANSQSYYDREIMKLKRVAGSPFLGEQARKDILEQARNLFNGTKADIANIDAGYRRLAARAPVDLEYILGADPRNPDIGDIDPADVSKTKATREKPVWWDWIPEEKQLELIEQKKQGIDLPF